MEKSVDVTEVKEESEEITEEVKEEELESEVPEETEMEPEDEADLEEEIEEEDSEFIEAKKRSKKEKKEELDQEIVEERFYTIPLRKVWISPRKKRAPKAARVVRQFVTKHMKINSESFDEDEELERVVIDNEVNEKLWSRGIEKPPRKIRVRVVKDTEGVVTVLLAEGD
jgi:large subunit ribosomal protein L31e